MMRTLMAYFCYVVALLIVIASLFQETQQEAAIFLGATFLALFIGMLVEPNTGVNRR